MNLTGNSKINSLVGNAAANVHDGKGGADTLRGARGNDTYVVDNAGDRIIELAGQGADIARISASYTLDAGASVETLIASGNAAISLTGSASANSLVGNAARNTLNGGRGIDTMSGLAGNDTYVVDNPRDKVIEAVGRGTDTVRTSVSYALDAGASVETLQVQNPGSTAAFSLTGNAFANKIFGNKANNAINGRAGGDTMQGFAGNDTYTVDNVRDVVVEAAAGGIDRVNSSVTETLAANVDNLTLTGRANINGTGNGLNNFIIGNAGINTISGATGNDLLNGGANDDVIIGGPGRDTMTGSTGRDRFDFNAAGEIGNGPTPDVIADFVHLTDDIDLSTIDANGALAGNTAFTFRPAPGTLFTGAPGQLRWFRENPSGTADDRTTIQGDTDGDRVANFEIRLLGLHNLTAADFIL